MLSSGRARLAFFRPRAPEPPDESSYSWDVEVLRECFHSPSEFISTRGDVARLADARINRELIEAYEDLPGTRSGLTAATVGAGAAAAILASLHTLWALLPGLLSLFCGAILVWAGMSHRAPVHSRRDVRTRR
jgi:hypothetical protein